MHNPFDIISKNEDLRIGGLGDSLTYGWEVERGFFDRFCNGLASRHPRTSLVRLNEGVPGDTARGGLARLPAMLSQSPHLLLVQFGLNDMFCGIPVSSYAESLAGIVDQAMEAGVRPWLVVSSPLALPREESLARAYYDAIRELGHDRGVTVADLDAFWRSRFDPGRPEGRLFLADGVHPDDAGHALMADGLLVHWDLEAEKFSEGSNK